MAEEKNMTVATEEKTEATAPKTENQYLLKLNRPYVFEGKEYAEIDLAGLDKLLGRRFTFVTLPLKFENADGCSCRAIALEE